LEKGLKHFNTLSEIKKGSATLNSPLSQLHLEEVLAELLLQILEDDLALKT